MEQVVLIEQPKSLARKVLHFIKNPKQLMKSRYGRYGLALWICWEIFGVIRVILYAPLFWKMGEEYNKYIALLIQQHLS